MKAVSLGALNGMLEAVDPFASYLNADQYRDYPKNKDAHRADVGLILSKKFGYLGVLDSIPNSPAAKAGLGYSDIIEGIKGISTSRYVAGDGADAAAGRFRDHRGTERGARAASRSGDHQPGAGQCRAAAGSEPRCWTARWATSTSMRSRRRW